MAWTSFAALDIKAKDPCDVAKQKCYTALAVAEFQQSCNNLKFLKSVFLF